MGPDIGMDDSGNAVAVWLENDADSVAMVMANRYTPTTGWGTPVRIDSQTNTASAIGGLDPPRIAVNGSGNAVAVWQERQPIEPAPETRHNIWSSRYNVTTGQWSTAALLETDDSWQAVTPDVAIDGSGNAIAVWVQDIAGDGEPGWEWGERVITNRYVASTGTWTGPEPIFTPYRLPSVTFATAGNPAIAMNGAGKAIAVWYVSTGGGGLTHEDAGGYRIFASRFDGTSWGSQTLIDGVNTSGGGIGPSPQIAMNDSGDAIALWDQDVDGPSYTDIWANLYSASTGWGTAEKIGACDTANWCAEPQVAIDNNGNAIAVWDRANPPGPDYSEIVAKRYVPGTGWGGVVFLDDLLQKSYDMRPQVAMDNNGNALVVWDDQGTTFARRYVVATGWGDTITTLVTQSNSAYDSRIAMNKGCGNAIAVWRGGSATSSYESAIHATRFH
jgi:hypothetical protein